LDHAGKTTLLHMLKSEKLGTHLPTQHPNVEELVMGSINFKTIDLGGHEFARRMWKEYFTEDVSAIVFVVDASAPERFLDVKRELGELLSNESLAKCPFLILGNKIDKTEKAVSESELLYRLDLEGKCTGKGPKDTQNKITRPVEVFMCSILNQSGYGEGFRWVSQYID
jgi:GTP-binding protein SAR1